jgi:hypothetical protein
MAAMPSAPTSRRALALAWCVAALAPVFLLAVVAIAVVREPLQPDHASLWLRTPGARP